MSFIPPASAIRAMMAAAPADALNLAIGEPRFPTPKIVLDYVQNHLHRWPLGYTDNAGSSALREAIAHACGPQFRPEQVCVTCGAQEALFVACHTLLSAGDEALVPDPGFLAYSHLVRMAGATAVRYPAPLSSHESFDFDDLSQCISTRTRAIFINSPANPTGVVLREESMRALADLCDKHNITIIADEVYRELYYANARPPGIALFSRNSIVISSLSKTFSMTGWRLGWALCPTAIAQDFIRVHQYLTTCASTLAQHAAVFIFQGGVEAAQAQMRTELAQRCDLLAQGLPQSNGWKFTKPEAGLFIFARLPQHLGADDMSAARQILQRNKVITVPGSAFGKRGEGFLRLSFAAERQTIAEACRRMANE